MEQSITANQSAEQWVGLRFIAHFLVIFIIGTLGWSSARGTDLERLVIDRWTVSSSARLIDLLNPGEGVRAEGPRLVSTGVRLTVLNGCEGTESILLLAAAVIALPVPWRRKPLGLLLGTACIFLLNQARIVGLYFVLRHHPLWFESVHGYVAPVAIVLVGILFFTLWLRWASRGSDHGVQA